jgi:hypothetical protein
MKYTLQSDRQHSCRVLCLIRALISLLEPSATSRLVAAPNTAPALRLWALFGLLSRPVCKIEFILTDLAKPKKAIPACPGLRRCRLIVMTRWAKATRWALRNNVARRSLRFAINDFYTLFPMSQVLRATGPPVAERRSCSV